MKKRNPLYRLSIRTKIAFMIIVSATVFGAGIFGFIYYQTQNSAKEAAISKTRIIADSLSAKAMEPVQAEDLNTLQLILGEATRQTDVAYCFIRDGRGKVLSSSFDGGAVPAALQTI